MGGRDINCSILEPWYSVDTDVVASFIFATIILCTACIILYIFVDVYYELASYNISGQNAENSEFLEALMEKCSVCL